jgi:hypothetical protein
MTGGRHLVGHRQLHHGRTGCCLDGAGPSATLLRDGQAASHGDPRTTMRYDRARGSLDRHPTYVVAAYLAGAAR